MKTYMPLNGLRWSRNSGSANCDMPQSAVFGRPGGGELESLVQIVINYKRLLLSFVYDKAWPFVNKGFIHYNDNNDNRLRLDSLIYTIHIRHNLIVPLRIHRYSLCI